jgi:Uma2 family endonuclease
MNQTELLNENAMGEPVIHQPFDDDSEFPLLETGDRLSRCEFERHYEAMPEVKKAELIEGMVYMGSPVRHRKHSSPHVFASHWLSTYRFATPGTDMGDNGSVRLDEDNETQPDLLLRIEEECGGQSRISADDYLEGAPELVVEIAASSASYDLHDKLKVYRRTGVREYLVWRVRDKELDWFRLHKGRYLKVAPDANGIIASSIFPGLRLAVNALLKGEMAEVLKELQLGLDTLEHKTFVTTLQEKRRQKTTKAK